VSTRAGRKTQADRTTPLLLNYLLLLLLDVVVELLLLDVVVELLLLDVVVELW
jgi:hypothetical protein